MKKAILFFAALGFWFVSCQKDSADMSPVTDADQVSLETVETAAARLSLETDSVTVKACKGKLTEVAVAELAASITAYITTTYPSSTITFAAKDESGRVVVSLLLADGTPKGLIFNADGTFKEELKRHAGKVKLTEVAVADLPAAMTTYITAGYAGADVKKAGTNAEGQYFVGIVLNEVVKVLLFNADGSFNKELEKPVGRGGSKRH